MKDVKEIIKDFRFMYAWISVPICLVMCLPFLAMGSYWLTQYCRNYSCSEEVYSNLQAEVERMIENRDFESEYYFTLSGYDNKSYNFRLEIFDSDISVAAKVSNFGKSNQMIEYKQFSEKLSELILSGIFTVLILSILGSILTYEIVLKPCIYIGVILFHVFKKLRKRSLKETE